MKCRFLDENNGELWLIEYDTDEKVHIITSAKTGKKSILENVLSTKRGVKKSGILSEKGKSSKGSDSGVGKTESKVGSVTSPSNIPKSGSSAGSTSTTNKSTSI